MIYELFLHDGSHVRWCAFLTCFACTVTFLLSCLYHSGMNKCKCQSEYNSCLNLDVRGVLFSSTFTGISPVINGYKCNYPIFVWTSVFLLICSMSYCWYNIINDTATAKKRGKYIGWHSVLRTVLALSMVCGNMIWHHRNQTMWWHLISLLLLAAGGAINVNRYPEKWFVNKYVSSFFLVKDREKLKRLKKEDNDGDYKEKEEYYEFLDYIRYVIDYVGNSHQIFHIFVVFSCITVYYGAVWDDLYLQNTVCDSTIPPRIQFEFNDGQDKSAFYAVAMELIFEPSFLYPF